MKVTDARQVDLDGSEQQIEIVVARFNEIITQRLLDGAISGLKDNGVSEKNISVLWVPGAFELPVTAQHIARQKKPNAIICIGAVIKGDTAHFEHVSNAATNGIAQVSLSENLPVIFSVLTVDTVAQAEERSENNKTNTGYTSAQTAIEMATLFKQTITDKS